MLGSSQQQADSEIFGFSVWGLVDIGVLCRSSLGGFYSILLQKYCSDAQTLPSRPPCSGAKKTRALRAGPQEKIKTLGPAVAGSEEARQAQEMFGTVQADVEAFKAERWGAWCHLVSQTSEAQLRKPLLQ